MNFVEINPAYRRFLTEAGLATAADILALAGEPVCVRPDRRVDRIALGGGVAAFLKKETHILVRERLSSWLSGYGWSSKSVREAIVLGELAGQNLACPVVLALGEEAGQAFVLLKAERELQPIDVFLRRHPERSRHIAHLIGREIARIHEAGYFHPDLFAKHVLVGRSDGLDRVCLIDWQRTRRIPSVAWSRRIADLATLDASLAFDIATPRDRLCLLASYLRCVVGRRPQLRFLIDAIGRRSRILQKRRRVGRQRSASSRPISAPLPVSNRHEWHNCPLRLTDPNLSVLPLVKFLRGRADLFWHRRTLRRFGQSLRELHEAGYIPSDPRLESWVVNTPERSSADELSANLPGTDDVEIFLTSVADLTPTTAAGDVHAADDLARLLAFHESQRSGPRSGDSRLSRADLLRVAAGYLGAATRGARRDLVCRILAARETAR